MRSEQKNQLSSEQREKDSDKCPRLNALRSDLVNFTGRASHEMNQINQKDQIDQTDQISLRASANSSDPEPGRRGTNVRTPKFPVGATSCCELPIPLDLCLILLIRPSSYHLCFPKHSLSMRHLFVKVKQPRKVGDRGNRVAGPPSGVLPPSLPPSSRRNPVSRDGSWDPGDSPPLRNPPLSSKTFLWSYLKTQLFKPLGSGPGRNIPPFQYSIARTLHNTANSLFRHP